MMSLARLVVAVFLVGGLWGVACTNASPSASAPGTHPFPFRSAYSARSVDYLRTYIGEPSLVQLGESIHMTEEFPRARLHLVRYLHEALGFDVLAFEGSLVDSWIAQDHLYRSGDTLKAKAKRAQELAWFGLWQTESMGQVMEYIAQTQSTTSPLYLASFDIQPGNSRASGGSAAVSLKALFAAVRGYLALESGAEQRWVDALLPFFRCRSDRRPTPDEQSRGLAAITELEGWIAQAASKVEVEVSAMHAAALRRIPESLRGTAELCAQSTESERPHAYQEVRDRISAAHAIGLRNDVSRKNRIMLWAHHSHISHNSTGTGVPSMGQHLLEQAGADLYTIGLFAGGGRATEVSDDAFPPVVPRRIRPVSDYGLERRLANARAGDYFIDFSTMNPGNPDHAGWYSEVSTRMETRFMAKTVPARDYHAAVFVREVQPAAPTMLPSAIWFALIAYGFVLDHLVAVLVGATLLLALIVWRWRRRRRRRALA